MKKRLFALFMVMVFVFTTAGSALADVPAEGSERSYVIDLNDDNLEPTDIFTDETLTFSYAPDSFDGYNKDYLRYEWEIYRVPFYDVEGGYEKIETGFTVGDDGSISISGAAMNEYKESEYDWFFVTATAWIGSTMITSRDVQFEVYEPEDYIYGLEGGDRVQYSYIFIDEYCTGYRFDKDHRDGEDVNYTVNEVTASGDCNIEKAGDYWTVLPLRTGELDITLEVVDDEGNFETKTVSYNILSEMLEVNDKTFSPNGTGDMHPNSTMYVDFDVLYSHVVEGLEHEYVKDFTITVDQENYDPSGVCNVTEEGNRLRIDSTDMTGYEEIPVIVSYIVYKGTSLAHELTCEETVWFNVKDDYFFTEYEDIEPVNVGEIGTIKGWINHSVYENGKEKVSKYDGTIKFEVYYDDFIFEIYDADGNYVNRGDTIYGDEIFLNYKQVINAEDSICIDAYVFSEEDEEWEYVNSNYIEFSAVEYEMYVTGLNGDDSTFGVLEENKTMTVEIHADFIGAYVDKGLMWFVYAEDPYGNSVQKGIKVNDDNTVTFNYKELAKQVSTEPGEYIEVEIYAFTDDSIIAGCNFIIYFGKLEDYSLIQFIEDTYEMPTNETSRPEIWTYEYDPKITWTSSDPSIASVDEDGFITAHKYSSKPVIIRATLENGMYDEIKVQTRFWDVAGSSNSKDPNYQYYYKAVYWAAEHNPAITKGYDLEYYGVDMDCKRDEFVLFLYRLAGTPSVDGSKATERFSDVGGVSNTFKKAIEWAYEQGITKGYNDGTFGVGRPITRQESMIMIYRFAGKPSFKSTKEMKFSDLEGVKPTSDTYKAIEWAYNMGITNGYSSQANVPAGYEFKAPCFGNTINCNRQDMITFLYRYADKYGKLK